MHWPPTMRQRAVPLLVVVAVVVFALAAAAVAALQFPALTGRVVDEAGLLSPAERQSLDEALKAHETATGNQVVVVTVKSLQDTAIDDYGWQLGRAWGIGRQGKNDGALLIVAPNERKVRIEVGYGLEGILTDAASRLIIERIMLPAFRSGQFGPGIVAGTGAILKMLAGEAEPLPQQPARKEPKASSLLPLLMLGVFLFLVWRLYRDRDGGPGAGGLGGRPGFGGRRGGRMIPPIIIGGGGLGGGWGGGGGGFGGGGGSFGGGGASGGW
jgi:uncharacterized protein